jgi:hypothetical protein
MVRGARGLVPALLCGAIVHVGLIRLGRASGSTAAERAAGMPGDDLVARPTAVTDHAITIDAPPEAVWPWLVQMGWHRAGWYTARWVDRLLFPANWPSATRVVPELQGLEIGDFVPDGPPETECGLYVVALEPERTLVLRSTSHLPASWRRTERAALDWSWAFALEPVDGGRRTRFHFRSRWWTRPWWLTAGGWLLVVPADHVMARSMLHGVRVRAERLASEAADRGSSPLPFATRSRKARGEERGGAVMNDVQRIDADMVVDRSGLDESL